MAVRETKRASSIASCPLYGVSPLLLASTFHLPEAFTTKWKIELRRKPSEAAAVAEFVRHDLGAFDPAWRGFLCKDGLLWTPEDESFRPGDVRAINIRRAQLQEYERAQRWMIDSSLAEHSSQFQQRAKVLGMLEAAIEALRQR